MPDLTKIQERELAALADDLSALDPPQWRTATLCGDWDVEEALAHLGATPQETLERFRHIGTIALPVKSSPAGLGEVIVHAEDIRRSLGLRHTPDADGLLAVARFFASKDFAVNSKTLVKGLALRATDADFHTGNGPEVRVPLLSLVMVMAGRDAFLADLSGDGVPQLSARLAS